MTRATWRLQGKARSGPSSHLQSPTEPGRKPPVLGRAEAFVELSPFCSQCKQIKCCSEPGVVEQHEERRRPAAEAQVAMPLKVSGCQIIASQTVGDWKGPQDEPCGHGAGPAGSSSGSACQERRSQAPLCLSAAQRACTTQPRCAWLQRPQAQPNRSAQEFGNLCEELRASKPRAYKI